MCAARMDRRFNDEVIEPAAISLKNRTRYRLAMKSVGDLGRL